MNKEEVIEMLKKADGALVLTLEVTDKEKRMGRTGFACDFPKDANMMTYVYAVMAQSPEARRGLVTLAKVIATVLSAQYYDEYMDFALPIRDSLEGIDDDKKIAN